MFLKGLVALCYLGILAAAALTDRKKGRIYNCFPAGIILLGAVSLWKFPECGLRERLAGMMVVAIPMLALTLLVKDAFGGGDIKLMAAGGFFLGWQAVSVAAVIGLFLSGAYCAGLLIRGKLTWKGSVVLGPFLSIGLGAAFLWRDFGRSFCAFF